MGERKDERRKERRARERERERERGREMMAKDEKRPYFSSVVLVV
jgi:hypothetical protein